MKRSTGDRIGRISLIVFSLFLIFIGAAHLLRGSIGWTNYWGGIVFAPIAILFGLLLLYAAIFRWRAMQENPGDKKGRVPDVFKDDWRKW